MIGRSELAKRLDEEKHKAEAAAQEASERVQALRSVQQQVAATAQEVRWHCSRHISQNVNGRSQHGKLGVFSCKASNA